MSNSFRVRPDRLRYTCDPERLEFGTTEELKPLTVPIGQKRAADALEFGVNMPGKGYNVFVVGPVGTGRTSITNDTLQKVSRKLPTPPDICYLHNFENPNEPKAITLPAGRANELRDDMQELVEDVQGAITSVFESEEYVERREEVVREFREKRQQELAEFEAAAEEAGFVVGRGPAGVVVAPAKDGEVMSAQDYAEMSQDQRKEIEDKRADLQDKLNEILRKHHRKEKKARARVKELDQEEVAFAIDHLFEALEDKYSEFDVVIEHLQQVREDIIEHIDDLKAQEDSENPDLPTGFPGYETQNRYKLYKVNVLLSRDPDAGAPVTSEANPTIENLTGAVEHQTRMGALVTDYTMIRPGALHKANGGYLILEAEAVLTRPYAWDALKRALKNGEIRIESLADQIRFMSTVKLEPQPIPLDLKVVLIGTPMLYYLLYQYDNDFQKLFKVKSDFETRTKRTMRQARKYARFIATLCNEEELSHFDSEAVAEVVEHAVRLADDQKKLTTRFSNIADLVREAAYWAEANEHSSVTADDVREAIDQHTYRNNRIEELYLEWMDREFLLIDVEGRQVGQVNSLSVIPVGDYWFGRPDRITARTYVGKDGITQIDREAKLTGRIHDKGVLILAGLLADRYAQDAPLALTATLTFEQIYSDIEGDSASLAELCALLSSLSEVPISQEIAVTGSVNQAGQTQAVGGINEKIEGFYKACQAKGITGKQGVIIPASNADNLVLDRDVIDAVQQEEFHIYAVENIDDAMELLTGEKMGKLKKDGTYPEDTINGKAKRRLRKFVEAAQKLSGEGEAAD